MGLLSLYYALNISALIGVRCFLASGLFIYFFSSDIISIDNRILVLLNNDIVIGIFAVLVFIEFIQSKLIFLNVFFEKLLLILKPIIAVIVVFSIFSRYYNIHPASVIIISIFIPLTVTILYSIALRRIILYNEFVNKIFSRTYIRSVFVDILVIIFAFLSYYFPSYTVIVNLVIMLYIIFIVKDAYRKKFINNEKLS